MSDEMKYEELMELIEQKQYRKLKETLSEMNEADIAELLEDVPQETAVLVYRMLPKELATDVFALLPVEQQEHIINGINDAELKNIVEDLFVDDAVDMLEELPATVVRRVLHNATPETRNTINQFLRYPDNSAGSVMTSEYIGLKKGMTVRARIQREMSELFKKYDIVLCPTCPTPAFRLGQKVDDPLEMYLSDLFTTFVNLARIPSISVPAGMSTPSGDETAMPIGMQFAGPMFSELKLLQLAQAWENDHPGCGVPVKKM